MLFWDLIYLCCLLHALEIIYIVITFFKDTQKVEILGLDLDLAMVCWNKVNSHISVSCNEYHGVGENKGIFSSRFVFESCIKIFFSLPLSLGFK